MDSPNIDLRDEKAIKKQIKDLADQYLPEWRYSEKDPDVGVVFAEVFAGMLENSISIFNKTPHNYYLTFLNLLGAKLLSPIPAVGMITVKVVEGAGGLFISKGTSLYAPADNDEGRVYYETSESMFAVDLNIESIFVTDAKKDCISKIYDRAEDEKIPRFKIFKDNGKENLQLHEIYFEDDNIFNFDKESKVILNFIDKKSKKNTDYLNNIFSDLENVDWQYYRDGNWIKVGSVNKLEDSIELKFDYGIDESEKFDKSSYFVKCTMKKVPDKKIVLTDIFYKSSSFGIEPDILLLDVNELSKTGFFPFGEQYSSYTDFYISSEDAFTKKGAKIKINVDMKFMKVKLDSVNIQDNTRYRYIMNEVDFREPEEVDIEIEKVSWEYWNGFGWAKIYDDDKNEDFFKLKNGNNKSKSVLEFDCPKDMGKILLGPKEGFYIRARILKVKNPFSSFGSYITPYINRLSIDYEYEDLGLRCKNIYVKSNMEDKVISLNDGKSVHIFDDKICESPAMYFNIDKPIKEGPVKILFDIAPGLYSDIPALKWEYYSKDVYGNFSWKNMDVLDKTEGMSNSAIVTLLGKKDFEKAKLFGAEGYFLRVVNHDNKYCDKETGVPVIKGIYVNTVPVLQVETRIPEYFTIDNMQLNKICNLSNENVYKVEVWVNEFGSLSSIEENNIVASKDDIYNVEYDASGRISEIWIKWDEVNNIDCAVKNERVYEVDYKNGMIKFGDGKHGKIPTHQAQQSIRINYRTCDGVDGNIDARSIEGFSDAIPYVDSVVNLKQFVGGVDKETIFDAAKRMSSKISGVNRIVTLDDFELAIKCNNRNIYAVKCLPHVNKLCEKSIGTISVAILPKDYMKGYEKFSVIKERVSNFIESAAPAVLVEGSNIDIFEVMYVEISVKLDVVISDYKFYQSVYRKIYNQLKIFLDPIVGNFNKKGWEIGVLPRKESIYNYIKSIPNIKLIRSIDLFTKAVTLNGKEDVDLSKISKKYFMVPVFGEPEINILFN